MSSATPQTPRRSKRFQPFLTPLKPRSDSSTDIHWAGDTLHIRPVKPELDCLDGEENELNEENSETMFFGAFRRKTSGMRSFMVKKVAKGKQGTGVEEYKVGDTVLISTTHKVPSVGVIIAMWEIRDREADEHDSGESKMRVKVRWFLRPTELASIRAKRKHAENEIHFTLNSTEILRPASILSHCTVSGQPLPPSKLPSSDADIVTDGPSSEIYYCHLAVDSMRGLFYEFDWPAHRRIALQAFEPSSEEKSTWGDTQPWNVIVEDVLVNRKRAQPESDYTPKRKRQKVELEESDDSGDEFRPPSIAEEDEDVPSPAKEDDESGDESLTALNDSVFDDEPKTPSKRRTRTVSSPRKRPGSLKLAPTTPRRPRGARALAQPTPHTRAALIRRTKQKLAVRPAAPAFKSHQIQGIDKLPKDPWLRAMHLLHVGSRPDALPCREEEFKKVLRSVQELIEEGSGGCVYISGVPGTGKTATVHAVVRELKRMAEESETNPFTYVEINGLKIPEPSAAYSLLWEAVSGHDVEREGHLRISSKESLKALTRHFSGRAGKGPGGHACVVLMDELDQLVTAKQDVVYNFFNWPTLVNSKLVVLAVANTMDLPERAMTGRVRSRLGMIRINFQPYTTPQLEKIVKTRLLTANDGLSAGAQEVIAADGIKFAAMKVSSISGDARRVLDICRRTVELVQKRRRTAKTEDVRAVIAVMQNSPTAAYLRDCSFHERMMLAALVKCVKREGVDEIKWGEVQHQHIIYMNVLTGPDDPTRRPTPGELALVLDSLLASRAILMEDGVAASRKAEGDRRVILNLEQGEVERVLSEVGGARWKNVLSG